MSRSLDRRRIAAIARAKYSKEVVGKQYDGVLKQLADLSGRGWYAEKSRKFARRPVSPQEATLRKPRIWLYMPYFGAFPNYFQLYLDSLGKNADYLSVFLMTDNNLSGYRVPENLIPIQLTLGAIREKAARLINEEFGLNVLPDALLKQPYKLNDFRILYFELFRDVSEHYGVTRDDFVGWGDCDLIYGLFSDFLDMDEDYHVIGGFHGHFTAVRNIDLFRKLFKAVEDLPTLLLDEQPRLVDEVAFRKPLQDVVEANQYKMFYINRYFCDIVPECFFGLYRQDHADRNKNFFEVYRPDKEINYVHYDRDGRLSVVYEEGDSRQSIYCHLQKRAMSVDFEQYKNGYYIREDAFCLALCSPMNAAQNTGAALPVEFKHQHQLDPALANYLAKAGPHNLELGAGWNSRPGWLATDLNPPPGHACMRLDATTSFEIPSESFDFIYSEHMIEHISFEDGRNMLEECNRILKPSGVIRIVTPSLGFLYRVMSPDRGQLEERYRNWSVTTWVPEAPQVTNAFFLNNFVRAWGHTFVYDRETLELALRLSGFESVVSCELNNSEHPLLCGLANVRKIPPGFLDLESMVLEGTKARSVAAPAPRGRNLALGKPATQSSISPWSLETSPECEATRVVSGRFTGSYNCHTGFDSPSWWRVDLGEIEQISEVRIYNRICQNQAIVARASRLEIQASNDDQTWKTVFRKETNTLLRGPTRTSPFIWIPEEQISGRYIRIQLLDQPQYLHLEQVEIYGP
jgi:predicted SAM-dependent methyltransferase